MLVFKIIMGVMSFLGMIGLARELDKNEAINTPFNALCVGGIACCGILLGLILGLLFAPTNQ